MLTRDHKGGARNIPWDSARPMLLEGGTAFLRRIPSHQQMAGTRGALSFRPGGPPAIISLWVKPYSQR
jgi:hypothetical protein